MSDPKSGWAAFFAELKHAAFGSFWLPAEIEREMPLSFICGMVCNCGPNGEPLACGYKRGHDGEHSWATLPTFAHGAMLDGGSEQGDTDD